ncbi:MAG: hypothetical protein R2716_12805 [Microthrixaceae bacterium]
MDQPSTYRIEIRGHPGDRLLRPFEDFEVLERATSTALVGPVTDASHLHGLIVHLTSLNAEVLSVNRIDHNRSNQP